MDKIFNKHLGIRIPNSLSTELMTFAEKEMLSVSDIVRRGIVHELNVLREKYKIGWTVK